MRKRHYPRVLMLTLGVVAVAVTALAPSRSGLQAEFELAASTRSISVLDANVQGGGPSGNGQEDNNLQDVKARISNSTTPYTVNYVTLQEVCSTDLQELKDTFTSWDFEWVPQLVPNTTFPNDTGCPIANPLTGVREPSGVAIGTKFGFTNVSTVDLPGETTNRNGNDGQPAATCTQAEKETSVNLRRCRRDYKLLCGDTALTVGGVKNLRICSVHQSSVYSGYRLRQIQNADVATALAGRIANNTKAVVLGGDFNANPPTSEMNAIYRLSQSTGAFNGTGDFFEADQTDSSQFATFPGGTCHFSGGVKDACRSGQLTSRSGYLGSSQALGNYDNKFDYVFFSRNAISGGGADSTLRGAVHPNAYSAHDMFVGTATIVMP